MQEQIKGTMYVISQNERNAGNDMGKFNYSIKMPAQQIIYLGLVLDTENSQDGFNVLSVTPGGIADKLAIQPGDKVKAINNTNIDSADKEKAIEQLKNALTGEELSLIVVSNGEENVLTTKLIANYIPEITIDIGALGVTSIEAESLYENDSQTCGEISDLIKPPVTQDIYPVAIQTIDGRNINNFPKHHRLKTGKHTILMQEMITEGTGNSLFAKRGPSTKGLVIDVKPNMSYRLGAKFIRKNRSKTVNEEYWEPVIWKSKAKKCSL
jgi:hypothetical protein